MYIINGFASITPQANNAIGAVAPLGELSPLARTYSKEKAYFAAANLGIVEFVSFDCRDLDGDLAVVPNTFATNVLEVINWVYLQGLNGALNDSETTAASLINTQFSASISDLSVGTMKSNGAVWLPTWLEWSFATGGAGNKIKIWFADEEFKGQYPNYEIIVIPPIDNLDSFFSTYAAVKQLLDSRSVSELGTLINAARGEFPETLFRIDEYDWVNPLNASIKLTTNWTVLIYGIAGNNIDIIKATIIDYILANSTHDRDEWKELFPSLFISTEFIITPFWNRYSIPNMTEAAGLYSPTFKPSDIVDYLTLTATDYNPTHLTFAGRGSVVTYKSLAFAAVGNPENVDGLNIFTEKFPDYIAVAPTSLDFFRMSPDTQAFVNLLNAMLPVAEAMTEFSTIPVIYNRIWRDGIMFLGASLDGVLYLVTSKHFFNP